VDANQSNTVKYDDVTVKLTGGNGNAMVIIGRVSGAIRRAHGKDAADAFIAEATSGDYDNVLATCMRTVHVV
jgi:hypothetical protein